MCRSITCYNLTCAGPREICKVPLSVFLAAELNSYKMKFCLLWWLYLEFEITCVSISGHFELRVPIESLRVKSLKILPLADDLAATDICMSS